jgi:glycolate oxidase FAD binding subunit
LRPHGALAALPAEDSRILWQAVRDVVPFADGTQNAVWRISTTPSEAPAIASAIRTATGAQVYYDWAGGLIWVAMPGAVAEEWTVRAALAGRGHALLMRADPAARASAHIFEPLDAGLAALTKRLKESFDPKGILNPGRMYAGV